MASERCVPQATGIVEPQEELTHAGDKARQERGYKTLQPLKATIDTMTFIFFTVFFNSALPLPSPPRFLLPFSEKIINYETNLKPKLCLLL